MKNDSKLSSKNDNKLKKSEDIRNLFLNNVGIKLGSIIVAIIVWTVIINIDDPYKTRTFSVEVETINESALKSVNKVYEVIEGSTANVKVTGKKSVVDKLEASDIKATADLSDLSSVNAVAIVPSLQKNVSSEVTLECSQVLKVSLEDMSSKQVKVTVVTDGTPEEGYTIGECKAKPNMIEVSGGESTIEDIDSVKVFLNVNNVSEDIVKKLEPIAYDADGNEITSSTLSYSNDTVKVFAEVLEDKKIPVKVKVTGKPANGYVYVENNCLPEEVEIAGTSKMLSGVSEITIPIDITGMTSSSPKLEQDVTVSDYLPDGVSVLEEYSTVSIKITIEQLVRKTIQVKASNISFNSLGEGLTANASDSSAVVNILVSGRASVLNNLDEDEVTAYVNCDGLSEGTYTLPVMIDIDDSCDIIDESKLKIKIIKDKDVDESLSSTPKPSSTKKPTASVTNEPSQATDEPDEDNSDVTDGDKNE